MMKRIISSQYSSGKVMGVEFRPERAGNAYVGVAVVTDEVAAQFEDREHFEVEDVEAAELVTFPGDFPLMAPQKAAMVSAGLDTLEKMAAHDFTATPVNRIAGGTQAKLHAYLVSKGLTPVWGVTPPAPAPARQSTRAKDKPATPEES